MDWTLAREFGVQAGKSRDTVVIEPGTRGLVDKGNYYEWEEENFEKKNPVVSIRLDKPFHVRDLLEVKALDSNVDIWAGKIIGRNLNGRGFYADQYIIAEKNIYASNNIVCRDGPFLAPRGHATAAYNIIAKGISVGGDLTCYAGNIISRNDGTVPTCHFGIAPGRILVSHSIKAQKALRGEEITSIGRIAAGSISASAIRAGGRIEVEKHIWAVQEISNNGGDIRSKRGEIICTSGSIEASHGGIIARNDIKARNEISAWEDIISRKGNVRSGKNEVRPNLSRKSHFGM